MKQFLAIAFLIGLLYFSKADIDIDGSGNVAHIEKRIVSSQRSQANIIIDEDDIEISQETTEGLLQIMEEALQNPNQEFNINESVDSIIESIARQILLGPYDPADLSNQDIVFQFRPLLITYTGTLNLTIGRLQDLSAVTRNNDATLVSLNSNQRVRISIPLGFRNVLASYNFLMNVRRDTASGVLYAWVSDKIGRYNIEIDVLSKRIISSEFFVDIGSLDMSLFGSGLSSTYRNLITDLTEDLLAETVIEYAEAIVGGYLNAGFKSVLGVN